MVEAALIFFGSLVPYFFHLHYGRLYDEYKDELKDIPKNDFCAAIAKREFWTIIVCAIIFMTFNPTLILFSIGSLIFYLTVKIPALESSLENE